MSSADSTRLLDAKKGNVADSGSITNAAEADDILVVSVAPKATPNHQKTRWEEAPMGRKAAYVISAGLVRPNFFMEGLFGVFSTQQVHTALSLLFTGGDKTNIGGFGGGLAWALGGVGSTVDYFGNVLVIHTKDEAYGFSGIRDPRTGHSLTLIKVVGEGDVSAAEYQRLVENWKQQLDPKAQLLIGRDVIKDGVSTVVWDAYQRYGFAAGEIECEKNILQAVTASTSSSSASSSSSSDAKEHVSENSNRSNQHFLQMQLDSLGDPLRDDEKIGAELKSIFRSRDTSKKLGASASSILAVKTAEESAAEALNAELRKQASYALDSFPDDKNLRLSFAAKGSCSKLLRSPRSCGKLAYNAAVNVLAYGSALVNFMYGAAASTLPMATFKLFGNTFRYGASAVCFGTVFAYYNVLSGGDILGAVKGRKFGSPIKGYWTALWKYSKAEFFSALIMCVNVALSRGYTFAGIAALVGEQFFGAEGHVVGSVEHWIAFATALMTALNTRNDPVLKGVLEPYLFAKEVDGQQVGYANFSVISKHVDAAKKALGCKGQVVAIGKALGLTSVRVIEFAYLLPKLFRSLFKSDASGWGWAGLALAAVVGGITCQATYTGHFKVEARSIFDKLEEQKLLAENSDVGPASSSSSSSSSASSLSTGLVENTQLDSAAEKKEIDAVLARIFKEYEFREGAAARQVFIQEIRVEVRKGIGAAKKSAEVRANVIQFMAQGARGLTVLALLHSAFPDWGVLPLFASAGTVGLENGIGNGKYMLEKNRAAIYNTLINHLVKRQRDVLSRTEGVYHESALSELSGVEVVFEDEAKEGGAGSEENDFADPFDSESVGLSQSIFHVSSSTRRDRLRLPIDGNAPQPQRNCCSLFCSKVYNTASSLLFNEVTESIWDTMTFRWG